MHLRPLEDWKHIHVIENVLWTIGLSHSSESNWLKIHCMQTICFGAPIPQKFWEAHSRLYRRRFLQVKNHFATFQNLQSLHTSAPLQNQTLQDSTLSCNISMNFGECGLLAEFGWIFEWHFLPRFWLIFTGTFRNCGKFEIIDGGEFSRKSSNILPLETSETFCQIRCRGERKKS